MSVEVESDTMSRHSANTYSPKSIYLRKSILKKCAISFKMSKTYHKIRSLKNIVRYEY